MSVARTRVGGMHALPVNAVIYLYLRRGLCEVQCIVPEVYCCWASVRGADAPLVIYPREDIHQSERRELLHGFQLFTEVFKYLKFEASDTF